MKRENRLGFACRLAFVACSGIGFGASVALGEGEETAKCLATRDAVCQAVTRSRVEQMTAAAKEAAKDPTFASNPEVREALEDRLDRDIEEVVQLSLSCWREARRECTPSSTPGGTSKTDER